MSESHLALIVVLVLVVAFDALLLLVGGHRSRTNAARSSGTPPNAPPEPRLSVRAHQRNGKGAEFALDIAAQGWPAIAAVAVLAAVAAVCAMMWFAG